MVAALVADKPLKWTVSRDFLLLFFFSFPQAPDYTIRAVSNFFENSRRYFTAQGLPPVTLTPVANGKNIQSDNFFMISFGHLWVVELAYR
jgi:hypothetical protein